MPTLSPSAPTVRTGIAATVRQAIARVSVYAVDPSDDYGIADQVVAGVKDLAQPKLYAVLVAGGLDGLKPRDSRPELLRRLRLRLTARVRAQERAEV
jgi:hypothetical protein